MKPLRSYTVFVAVSTVERGAAIAGSRIVEVCAVRAPTRLAALNVGTALAADELAATVVKFTINKVWLGESIPGG